MTGQVRPTGAADFESIGADGCFHTLLQQRKSMLGKLDGDGVFLYASTSFQPVLGYAPADLVGRKALDHVVAAHHDSACAQMAELLAAKAGTHGYLRFIVRHANGTTRRLEMHATSARDSHGERAVVFYARDITDSTYLSAGLHGVDAYFSAVANIPGLFINIIDGAGRFCFVGGITERALGYGRARLWHMDPVADLIHPDQQGNARARLRALMVAPGREDRFRYQVRQARGEWREIEFFAVGLCDRRGQVMVAIGGWDITRTLAAYAASRRNWKRLELACGVTGLGLWEYDIANDQFYADARLHQTLGYEPGHIEFGPSSMRRRLHPDDFDRVVAALVAHMKGESDVFAERFRLRDAVIGWRWVACRAQVSRRDADGKALRMVGTQRDVHEETMARQYAAASAEQLNSLLASTAEGICSVDGRGRINYVNRAAADLLGQTEAALLGSSFQNTVLHRRDQTLEAEELAVSPLAAALEQGRHAAEVHDSFRRGEKKSFPAEYSVSPIATVGRYGRGAVVVFRDESLTQELAHRLSAQAEHDSLTGLYNRHGLEIHIASVLRSATEFGEQHALCLLDIDQFRVLNSNCGYAAGNELVRELSQALRKCLRREDVMARVGGDKFSLLLKHYSLERAAALAGELQQTVAAHVFEWQGRDFRFGASVGVVPLDGKVDGLDEALSAVDAACLIAKESGRNRIHVASHDDSAVPLRRNEMAWATRTREALATDRLRLFEQPIVAIDETSGLPRQREVLLRMLDSDGSLIEPGRFLHAAERHYLMPEIDRWVLRRLLAHLVASGGADGSIRYAVNLSGTSLSDSGLLEELEEMLAVAGVAPSCLCFEITETSAVANMRATLRLMRGLGRLGCEFALDDFGSGMSSLSYLKRLPVDYLKLDGSFTCGLLDDPADRAIIEAVCTLARQLGIRTVVEHVESAATLKQLAKIDVDYAQGFYLGHPQPLGNYP